MSSSILVGLKDADMYTMKFTCASGVEPWQNLSSVTMPAIVGKGTHLFDMKLVSCCSIVRPNRPDRRDNL